MFQKAGVHFANSGKYIGLRAEESNQNWQGVVFGSYTIRYTETFEPL